MGTRGEVLLVNPWIYDFAAFNVWIEPLGLLTIAAALREKGYGVTVIDCLTPQPDGPGTRPDGSGKLHKTVVETPDAVSFVTRRYGRYGIPVERFEAALRAAPRPNLVLVSSGMTYWYPGVTEAIRRVRALYGDVAVVLGGVYASLCPDHARRHSGADEVIVGPGLPTALRIAGKLAQRRAHGGEDSYADPRSWPAPAHDLVPRPYAALLTSWGCPWRCTYCASHRLQPSFAQRDPTLVLEEIEACVQRGIGDLVFYDDALLVDADRHLVPILDGVLARGLDLHFHTPNGLHASEITPPIARLMRRAGFGEVRLSLESSDPGRQRSTGGKLTSQQFCRAVENLRAAGFPGSRIAAYVLAGLPGQPLAEVEASVRFVHDMGIRARLAQFSPIPGTPEGDRAQARGTDPLHHNNTVFPYLQGDEYLAGLQRIKQAVTRGNAALGGNHTPTGPAGGPQPA